jgi:hypothetical protein
MGKYGSGILMLLTFGGLSIWTLIDLYYALCGKFHDGCGLPINVGSKKGIPQLMIVVMLFYIVLLGVAFVLI